MGAKDIVLKPIDRKTADALVKRVHYSGKVVNNSQMHIGVFYGGKLEGVMQFGPSIDKRKLIGVVASTQWHEFIELNRMAFTDALPRNSESRALSIAFKLLRKHAPQLKWLVTFADGTQCGDGTIYRAAGFHLTGFSVGSMWELPEDLALINNGPTAHRIKVQNKESLLSREVMQRTNGKNCTMQEYARRFGGRVLPGYQLRYIYFLDPSYKDRLTVPILPYSRIQELGAGMYRGEKIDARLSSSSKTSIDQIENSGATPTQTLSNLDTSTHEIAF
jgi:hypothetical protein